jgi:hypothetical protein
MFLNKEHLSTDTYADYENATEDVPSFAIFVEKTAL